MIEIVELHQELCKGKEFAVRYVTSGYYDIEPVKAGFQIQYKSFEEPIEKKFSDVFFGEWLDEPQAFGAFENGQLLGYVEGALEKWNNRYRISNICVFDDLNRHAGIGTMLMEVILKEAIKSSARMVIWRRRPVMRRRLHFIKSKDFK